MFAARIGKQHAFKIVLKFNVKNLTTYNNENIFNRSKLGKLINDYIY